MADLTNNKKELVLISELVDGDTVIVDGTDYTFSSKNHLGGDSFFGFTIMGKRFKKVERVLFRNWYKGEVRGWVTQR